jgi:hypothetical protein
MFHDIKPRKSFSEFIKQSQTEKPYRSADGAKRYPLGLRRYSNRCWQFINPDEVAIYYCNELMGTARSDDTYEFHMSTNRSSYGNGESALMSRLTPGWIRSCSTLGGCVYSNKYSDNLQIVRHEYPVFEGMRVHMRDGSIHESSKFVLETKIVNRKESKKYRAPHENMFKVADAMFKAMNQDDIKLEIGDYVLAYKAMPVHTEKQAIEEYALQDINDPIGTVMRLAVVHNYTACQYSWWSKSRVRFDKALMVKAMKIKFYEHIYEREEANNPNIFVWKQTLPGEKLPTASWGQRITVNGVLVKRYS